MRDGGSAQEDVEKSIMELQRPLDGLAQKSCGKINMKGGEPTSPFPFQGGLVMSALCLF